jgi:DNA-binding NarL/FixJ family response regulator
MAIRVFLADDHAVVRDGLRSILETEGDIQVVGTASNGRDALKQVKKLDPDVVVMDISMPEMNGIDATLKIMEAKGSVRIIILSMHHTAEHIFRALKAGARGYLLKESAGSEVVNAVRSVLSGKRYLSERIEETIIDDYIVQRTEITGASPLNKLSSREKEILQLVVEGRSSSEIAKALYISVKTVETYRSRLMQKLGVSDLPGLVKFAIHHGLTSLDT